MVWSEQTGTSIIVPSDRVAGDGRNYIVIGENVPPSIADNFTAAIVIRNGAYGSDTDIPPGGGLVVGEIGNLYPVGFFYWAIGITTAGIFEIVCYYLVVPSPTGEAYITRRRSIFSASVRQFPNGPPNDAQPVVRIGSGTYNEGTVELVSDIIYPSQDQLGVLPTPAPGMSAWNTSTDDYGLLKYYLLPDGMILVQGLLLVSNPALLVAGANATQKMCLHTGIYTPATKAGNYGGQPIIHGSAGEVPRLFDVKYDGIYIRTSGYAALTTGQFITISGMFPSNIRQYS